MDLVDPWSACTLSPVTARVTLLLLVLVAVAASPAAGQFQVICSLNPIRAFLGDDVVLPCHVEPPSDVAGLTVEWSKPDLKPDPRDRLGRVEYVHLRRNRKEEVDMKISSYMRRTALFRDRLLQGNVSLRIANVTLEDEGRYKCFLPKLKGEVQYSIVSLRVDPYVTTTETPAEPATFQTSAAPEETGGRSRTITVVLLCLLVLVVSLGAGVNLFLTRKQKELTRLPTVEVDC